MLRALAIATALALLGTAAHAIIAHTDGYGSPHSYITLALAAGIAVGALAIGAAWTQRRYVLAFALCVALLAGEAFGLIATAERLVAHRERQQAPLAAAQTEHHAARQRIAKAEAAVSGLGTSDRLRKAEATKAAADAAVVDKAAERGCAANCRALLEQQVTAAAAEVAEARAEVERLRASALIDLSTARATLAAMAPPASATPLADRLGIPGWSLDLLIAALGSIAANGLAAVLLIFASHGHTRRASTAPSAIHSAPPIRPDTPHADTIAPPEPAAMPVANVREHAARFAVECLAPEPDGRATLDAIKGTYLAWCRAHAVEPLPDARIGRALADLFGSAGLSVREVDGAPAIVGVALKSQQLARVA